MAQLLKEVMVIIRSDKREAFVIKVLHQQHSSWQGTITWVSGNETRPFRSVLELIRLMDETIMNGQPEEALCSCETAN